MNDVSNSVKFNAKEAADGSFGFMLKIMSQVLQFHLVGFNQIIVGAQPDLIITAVDNNDFLRLMKEEKWVRLRGLKSEFFHAAGEVFAEAEEFWRIDLAHSRQDVLSFMSSWLAALRKLHVQWIVGELRALAKGKSKVCLTRLPTMRCSHAETCANGGPANQRTVWDTFRCLQVSVAAPSGFEFAESSRSEALDWLHPSSRNNLGSNWDAALQDDLPNASWSRPHH